jgi:hypothetical protein
MFGGGKGGGGGSKPEKPSLLTAMRVQSSIEGEIIPIALGTPRLKGILFGYWDFKAIAHTDQQQVGGKGGGSQTVAQKTYTYQAAVLRGLCLCPKDLPLEGIGEIWGTQGKSGTTQASEVYVLAATTQVVVHAAQFTQDRGVSMSTAVNHDFTDYADPAGLSNLTFTDWVPMLLFTGGGAPPAGKYKVSAGTYTFNAADIGKTVRISYSYNVPAADSAPTAPPVLKNFTVFKGTRRKRRGRTSPPTTLRMPSLTPASRWLRTTRKISAARPPWRTTASSASAPRASAAGTWTRPSTPS